MFLRIINGLIIISLLGACGNFSDSSKKLKIGVLRHITIEEAEHLSIDANAERLLVDAATSRGHYIEFINPLRVLSTAEPMDYDAIISRVEVDAFADNLTDAYLRALHYFETRGIPVINSERANLNAQDKFRTILLAQRAGVPVRVYLMVYTLQAIQDLLTSRRIGFPFFVKQPYSGCGEGVFFC